MSVSPASGYIAPHCKLAAARLSPTTMSVASLERGVLGALTPRDLYAMTVAVVFTIIAVAQWIASCTTAAALTHQNCYPC